MSSPQCGFCQSKDTGCLVQCVQEDCNLWFCNGNSEEESVQHKESHILSHLHMADHRKIAVRQKNQPKVFSVICHKCDEPNVFDLYEQLKTRKTTSNVVPGVVFCRTCALSQKSYNAADWKPVIDCHHDILACCVSDSFVPVSLCAESSLKITKYQVTREAKKWIGEELGIRGLQDDYRQHIPPRKTYFKNEEEYSQHFVELERLQWLSEAVDCLSLPFMEDVTVYVDPNVPPTAMVESIKFATDAEIDRTKFRKGAVVTVYVERHGAVVPYRAFVNDMEELEGNLSSESSKRKWALLGAKVKKGKKKEKFVDGRSASRAVFSVVVSFRDKPLRQEHLCGSVSVEVCSDDIAHTRRLNALARFRGKTDYISGELKRKILGGQNQARDRHFMKQRECKELELHGLDEEQAEAVNLALHSNLCLIKGPAGTGKTKVLVTLVQQLLLRELKESDPILCCANSNKATDHLTLQFARECGNDRVTRIISKSVAPEDLSDELLALTLDHKVQKQLGKNYKEECSSELVEETIMSIIKSSHIICCTCNSAGCFNLKKVKFGTVIIDEATQASEADALIAITKGCRKVVMVGDDKQLGVAVLMRLLKSSNLELSLFERLLSMNDTSIMSCTLQTQYRMHPSIWKPLAEVVYGFEAHCMSPNAKKSAVFFQRVDIDGKMTNLATLAIHTSSFHEVAADGASSLNVQEAITVCFLVINLLRNGISAEDIGVITFYKGQAAQIRKILQNHTCLPTEVLKRLAINTVDAFQAQEKQCIILSCVRSGNMRKKNGQLGFLTDQRRVNVALSRAKDALLIVGNLRYLSKYSAFWQRLVSYYPIVSYGDAMESLARCQRLRKKCSCDQCSLYRGTVDDFDKLLSTIPRLVFRNVQEEGSIVVEPLSEGPPESWVDVLKEKRQDEVTLAKNFLKMSQGIRNVDLYRALEKHVLKYPQLKYCGYPLIFRKKSNLAGKTSVGDHHYVAYSHQVKEFQIAHQLRLCDRCTEYYGVEPDGSYSIRNECSYKDHAGDKFFDTRLQSNVYTCCKGRMRSYGCTDATAPGHVSRAYSGMNAFRSTHRVEPVGKALERAWKMRVLALDCEMIFTEKGYEVARVSVVDRTLTKVYDRFVRPEGKVLDYITRHSGVTEADVMNVRAKSLEEVHTDLLGPIIHKDTLLIGHSLHYDLLALRLIHMHVVDTTVMFMEGTYIPGLAELVSKNLKRTMDRGVQGHDSLADAAACMEIAELYVDRERQALIAQNTAMTCRVRTGHRFEELPLDVEC